jgi:hypothetical protein
MKTQQAINQITHLIKLGKGDVKNDIAFFISTIDDPTSRMLVAGLVRRVLTLKQSGKNLEEDLEFQLYSEALIDHEELALSEAKGGDSHVCRN